MVTDLARGKTIDEAIKITRNDVAKSLEGLPPVKMHCSNLAADALHAAIEDYLKKEGRGEWLNEKKKGAKKNSAKRKKRQPHQAA
jgi:nitrogen fixation NifU-like protein